MRITGGQITGGVTFTSPEPPQNQLWYFSEGANFPDASGGKSFPYDSDENVSTGLYGFELNFDTGQMLHPLAATIYNDQYLNGMQALTYFNNLPIDSRIDFAQGYNTVFVNNFPDPSTMIPNPAYWSNVYATLSYAGNVSIANVSVAGGNRVPQISFYVKSPDANLSIRQVMEQTFYDNANNSIGHDYSVVSNARFMTMIHYPGNAVPYITSEGARWIILGSSGLNADPHTDPSFADDFLPSDWIFTDYSNSSIQTAVSRINVYGSIINETANAFASGELEAHPAKGRSFSNAEVLAIFEALPVGSRIDIVVPSFLASGTSWYSNSGENFIPFTYTGNAFIGYDVSIGNTLNIPVEGSQGNLQASLEAASLPEYYSSPRACCVIVIHHPANVYDILAVTGGD